MSRRSLGISFVGHMVVAGACIFSLPFFNDDWKQPPNPIPVELVDISQVTVARVAPKPTPQPKPAAAPPKPAPPPEKPEEKPPEKPAEKPPEKPPEKPVVKAAPPPAEEGVQKAQDKPKKDPPKKPAEEKKDDTDISSILKGLKDIKPTPRAVVTQPAVPDATSADSLSTPAAGDKLSISELDALKQQLRSCWNFPTGAKDARNLIVDIIVEVNPDRTVRTSEIADTGRAQSDAFYRSAAEAARRAVLKCQPLRLPPDKYDMWKNMTIQFDPKDFL